MKYWIALWIAYAVLLTSEAKVNSLNLKNGKENINSKTCALRDLVVDQGSIVCTHGTNENSLLKVSIAEVHNATASNLTVGVGAECVHQCPLTNTSSLVWCAGQDLWEGDSLKCHLSKTTDVSQPREERFLPLLIGIGVGLLVGSAVATCIIICKAPDPTPPVITCPPAPQDQYTPKYSTSTTVPWKTADKEGDATVRLVSDKGPGSTFSGSGKGTVYTVMYEAEDKNGLTSTCTFKFAVFVRQCPILLQPQHGNVQCNNDRSKVPIYGNTCTFTCNPGFILQGTAVQECGPDKRWLGGGSVQCNRKPCGNLTLPDNTALSGPCTNGEVFESICTLQCHLGYSFPNGRQDFVQCQADGKWSELSSKCEDVTSPEILNCSENIRLLADRGERTAIANWTVPLAKDNTDGIIATYQTKGLSPGSRFSSDQTHVIQYEATDAAGNKATPCSFVVTVQEIFCPPPPMADRLNFLCEPPRISYGGYCNFTCYKNLPLVGPSQAFCEISAEDPSVGEWDWGTNNTAPTCEVHNCLPLNPPLNGALACDEWSNGERCQMLCNDKWDIPRGTSTEGAWVCALNTGEWLPKTEVPDCSALAHPDRLRLPSSVFYYSGNCSDQDALDDIKSKFIKALNESGYNSICTLNPEGCHVDNVNVTCGQTTRKKRSSVHLNFLHKAKREVVYTHEVFVNWNFVLDIDFTKLEQLTVVQIWDTLDSELYAMSGIVEQKIQDGHFDLIDTFMLQLERSSFQNGWSEMDCEFGWQARESTFTCVPCPTGTYYDSVSDDCISCPVGTYQDEVGQFQCEACPSRTSTLREGARNVTQCFEMCQEGTSSYTGLLPCTPCPPGTYQPMFGEKNCMKCPVGTTNMPGSINRESCKGFEILLSSPARNGVSHTLSSNVFEFTLTLWLLAEEYPLTSQSDKLLTLGSRDFILALVIGKELGVELDSSAGHKRYLNFTTDVFDGNWHHLLITWDSNLCDLNLLTDGSMTESFHVDEFCGLTLVQDLTLSLGDSMNSVGFRAAVSMLSLWNGTKVPVDVPPGQDGCVSDDTDALLSWNEFASFKSNLLIPTSCGDGNDCNPDPCNGHPCVDKVKSYMCHCERNYTGKNCETAPDYCAINVCQNGAYCNASDIGFTCLCADGFRGRFCEESIVDGNWSPWSEWSECSESCNGGQQSRTRTCNDPEPGPDGKECIGTSTYTQRCNSHVCPVCLPMRRQYGVVTVCNDTVGGGLECSVSCALGLTSTKSFNDKYICGAVTDYKWLHEMENKTLPVCTETGSPNELVLHNIIEVPGLEVSCQKDPGYVQDKIKDKMNQVSDAECIDSGQCKSKVTLTGCDATGRRKRSNAVVVIYEISANLSGTEYFVDGEFDNETAVKAIEDWANSLNDLEKAGRLLKEAVEQGFLVFTIYGQNYTVDANTLVQTGEVDCPDGMQAVYALCLKCEPGQYGTGGACVPCDVGYYQELEGQTSCIPCPADTSTVTSGADNITLCTEQITSTSMTSATALDTSYLEDLLSTQKISTTNREPVIEEHTKTSTVPTRQSDLPSTTKYSTRDKGSGGYWQGMFIGISVGCLVVLLIVIGLTTLYCVKKKQLVPRRVASHQRQKLYISRPPSSTGYHNRKF